MHILSGPKKMAINHHELAIWHWVICLTICRLARRQPTHSSALPKWWWWWWDAKNQNIPQNTKHSKNWSNHPTNQPTNHQLLLKLYGLLCMTTGNLFLFIVDFFLLYNKINDGFLVLVSRQRLSIQQINCELQPNIHLSVLLIYFVVFLMFNIN